MEADQGKQKKATEPRDLDIASMVKHATDKAGSVSVGRFNRDLHAAVQGALDAGRSVTLFADGTPANIVAIDRGMMRDDKGQRWGTLALMSDSQGKLGNRVTVGGLEQQTKPAPEKVPALAADARSEVRAHVAQARAWAPEEAARHASADLAAYHAPRASRTGDADSMQHLREDMALRARNSDPYRAELQRLDPNTLRDVLTQPVVAPTRDSAVLDRSGASPGKAVEAGSIQAPVEAANIVAAVTGAKRSVDSELDAQQRQAAKASIAANDRQGDAKREVIEHMTPEELKRFAAAGADKPKAEQVLRDAAAREERAAATGTVREPVPPLAERFNISRRLFTKEYEFRDQPGKIAFSERFNTLRSGHSTPAAAIAMIDRAGERGWATVRVTGSAEFKRQAWIAAEARGIKAIGYEPTKGDIDAARAERSRLGKEPGWQGGTVERAPDRASDRAPGRARDHSADRASDPTTAERPTGQRQEARAEDLVAAAEAARRREGAVRQDPSSGDEQRSSAKEDRKLAEFAVMAGAAAPDQADKSKPGSTSREAAIADIPSFANGTQQRGDKPDDRDAKDRQQAQRQEPERQRDRDQKRDVDQTIGRGIGSVAFMRALEQVMERDGVPQERRPEIRTIAQQQFAALRAEGKTVRVPLVDRVAPRRTPVHLPHYDVKRAAQERVR